MLNRNRDQAMTGELKPAHLNVLVTHPLQFSFGVLSHHGSVSQPFGGPFVKNIGRSQLGTGVAQ